MSAILFGTSRFLIYAVNSNFCSRTHHLATIDTVTDDDGDRQTQHGSISATLVRWLQMNIPLVLSYYSFFLHSKFF